MKTISNIQFIDDTNGQPLFAVIPYEHFKQISHLFSGDNPTPVILPTANKVDSKKSNLISVDGSSIALPHGGGHQLNIAELVDFFISNNIQHMAINQRAQKLENYPVDQRMTLDPLIRFNCLAKTPYQNTMQAVQDFTDALVSTGIFIRTHQKYPAFSRNVNAIEIVMNMAVKHLESHKPHKKWTHY